MPLILQHILDYVGRSAAQTGWQLLIILGPLLTLAFILHYLSRCVRGYAATLFGVDAYTYLTAPGVMVHELGHAFFCVIFGHRIIRMRLFSPSPDGTLGSVEHAFNPKSTYQKIGNFFIGTGPIWFGSAVVLLLTRYLLNPDLTQPADPTSTGGQFDLAALATQSIAVAWRFSASFAHLSVVSSWQFWLFTYLVFCIASHITLSRSDIDGAAQGFVSLVTCLILLNLLTLWLNRDFWDWASWRILDAGVAFCGASLFVIGLNVALAIFFFALTRVRSSFVR